MLVPGETAARATLTICSKNTPLCTCKQVIFGESDPSKPRDLPLCSPALSNITNSLLTTATMTLMSKPESLSSPPSTLISSPTRPPSYLAPTESVDTKSWFLLRACEDFTAEDGTQCPWQTLLYFVDASQPIEDDVSRLAVAITHAFDMAATSYISCVGVSVSGQYEGKPASWFMTLEHLVVYLRGLKVGKKPTVPDLWGLGGNHVRAVFRHQ